MMASKRYCFILLLLPLFAHAQSVDVKKLESRIEGVNTQGYQIAFNATSEEDVRNSLARYVRTFGKTRNAGGYITMEEPMIGGKQYAGMLYATTKQIGTTAAAWIGVQPAEDEQPALDQDLEKMVYNFGTTFHRERIQIQIDESLRALQTVEKLQGRLINQNRDLNNKIESNKREKIQLEKSLVENGLELKDLTEKLAANVKAQDSIAIATEQIRKVVEMHKERMGKVQ